MKKWNGKINSLSISENGCPELFAELSKTSHRERSARLRTLALIGLFALQHQKVQVVGAPISTHGAPTTASELNGNTLMECDPLQSSKKGLAAKLLQSA